MSTVTDDNERISYLNYGLTRHKNDILELEL